VRAVLERDFLSVARRRRSFLLRTLVALLVSLGILFTLQEYLHPLRDRLDLLAGFLFVAGGCSLLGALVLLTPPAVVGSILEERQRETLPLVLASPVGARRFVLAKIASRSLVVLTWALAALFPLSMVTLLGGVSGGQVLDLLLLSAGVVVEMAAWGVWVSTVSRRVATAAVFGYLLPLVRWGGTLLLVAWLAFGFEDDLPRERPPGLLPLWALAETTPFPGVFRAFVPREYGAAVREIHRPSSFRMRPYAGPVPGAAAPAPPPIPAWIDRSAAAYLLFSLVLAGLAVAAAGKRLSREAEPRTALLERLFRARRWLRPPPHGGNPMAWKEGRLVNTAASRPLYYGVMGVLVAGELLYVLLVSGPLRWTREAVEAGTGFLAGSATLLGLVAAVAGSASMAHERSMGTLDLLRASLLTPGEILRGKVGGAVRGLGLLALFPLLHVGALLRAGYYSPATGAAAVLLVALLAGFWCGVGTLCGMASFRMGGAVGRGAAAFGAFLLGLPVAGLAVALASGSDKSLAEFLITGCPPVTFALAIEAVQHLTHGEWLLANGVAWSEGALALQRWHGFALAWAGGMAAALAALWLLGPRLLARRLERERAEG
jgi:ABC-type transport system involved in multi-copper enzyme maturation permease subunit